MYCRLKLMVFLEDTHSFKLVDYIKNDITNLTSLN